MQAFFSLTSSEAQAYRINLFTIIHEICFYGQGGYDYNTVYNMPIWLRKFTYNKINEHYSKVNKANSSSGDLMDSTEKFRASGEAKNRVPKIKTPTFVKPKSSIKSKPTVRYSPKS